MTGPALRDLRPDDSERLLRWRNSPDVAPYMYSDHEITPAEHAAWFASAPTRQDRRYWIIEMDGAPVGLANLADIDRTQGRCVWAYYLAEPSVRGRGLGGWVEYAVLQHVFETLGLHKLWCEVFVENETAWKSHLVHGFQIEARFRDHVQKGGVWREVLGLGLLADDWRRVRAERAARLMEKGLTPPD